MDLEKIKETSKRERKHARDLCIEHECDQPHWCECNACTRDRADLAVAAPDLLAEIDRLTRRLDARKAPTEEIS